LSLCSVINWVIFGSIVIYFSWLISIVTPEYLVQRFKRERSAALRNAKIRLSNIKLEEITQIMRGKSKWIKH